MRVIHGDAHRGKEHPLYRKWLGILRRCNNPHMKEYPYYGGRGIRVLWKSYQEFKRDMAPTFRIGLSIDRKDVNGHYCASNCTWSNPKDQARNRRYNVELEFHGIIMCVSGWAEVFGMSRPLLAWRLKKGWSVERSIESPIRPMKLTKKL